MTPPFRGGGALKAGWDVPMSLNIPVKLGSETLVETGDAGSGVVVLPKRAVNSPTLFLGGSMG